MIQIFGMGIGATLIAVALLRDYIPSYWILLIGMIATLVITFWPKVKTTVYGVSAAGGKIPWKAPWVKWVIGVIAIVILWFWIIPWLWAPSGKLVKCFNFSRNYPMDVYEFEPGTYQSDGDVRISLPKDWPESRIVRKFSVKVKQWGSAFRPPPSTV